MRSIRNSITYTVAGNDGTRYENQTTLYRPRYLTALGAQRILRGAGREGAIVSRCEGMLCQ